MSVTLNNVRFSYCNLFQAKPPLNNPNGEPKYSTTILVPKNNAAAKAAMDREINLALEAGVSTKWNGKNLIFAMNGQTGKFIGDLPVSMGRYFAYLAGTASSRPCPPSASMTATAPGPATGSPSGKNARAAGSLRHPASSLPSWWTPRYSPSSIPHRSTAGCGATSASISSLITRPVRRV